MPDCTVTVEFISLTSSTLLKCFVKSRLIPPFGVSTPRVTDD